MPNNVQFGAHSDTGCVRENNEDCFGLAPEIGLFVLSDGMGGLVYGEVASRLTIDTVLTHCREAGRNSGVPLLGSYFPEVSAVSNRLASAIRLANERVYGTAQENAPGQAMGATVVAVQCDGERMSIAHVGDSRAYRLRCGALEQLTQDHSLVAEEVRQGRMTQQEAGCSTLQNVLIRALGVGEGVDVDVTEELLMDGDAVLLCSDGLTRELSDAQIAGVLSEGDAPAIAAGRLVELAKQAGGNDNITAIVLRKMPAITAAFARFKKLVNWRQRPKDQS